MSEVGKVEFKDPLIRLLDDTINFKVSMREEIDRINRRIAWLEKVVGENCENMEKQVDND